MGYGAMLGIIPDTHGLMRSDGGKGDRRIFVFTRYVGFVETRRLAA
jgi:hypothetical protein